jgi:aspartyl-tRNA(Asn)/glutamyl-tRNA(Gln) amidotransferase subunit A
VIDLKRPIDELVSDVKEQKITSEQLVQASLDAIEGAQEFHAILETSPTALAQAKEIDRKIAAGEPVGRLAGIPFIAKDNFLTFATPTTASSNMLKPFRAPYQATVIEKLDDEGAILVAKSNLDAYAHGSSTENSDFGPTKNPHDKTRVPGGSSGGSAAAVALGLACFALGTDTGGSIRQPAAFCGVVGLKPTYGLVSRYGVVAMGSSVDVIGPLANRVSDASLVLDVIAGKDPKDATTIEREKSYETRQGRSDIDGLRVGIIKEYLSEGTHPEVKRATERAVEKFKSAGAAITELSLKSVDLALACYYILVPAEVSSNLARYDGIRFGHSAREAKDISAAYLKSRDEGFGDEAKRRIMIGTYVLSSGYYDAYYKRAQRVRTLLRQEFDQAFKNFDLLISPTAPTPAFKLGEKNEDPLAMYASDIDTVAVNLIGAGAISLPAGYADGLPVGVQLICAQKDEARLLNVSQWLEQALAVAA